VILAIMTLMGYKITHQKNDFQEKNASAEEKCLVQRGVNKHTIRWFSLGIVHFLGKLREGNCSSFLADALLVAACRPPGGTVGNRKAGSSFL